MKCLFLCSSLYRVEHSRRNSIAMCAQETFFHLIVIYLPIHLIVVRKAIPERLCQHFYTFYHNVQNFEAEISEHFAKIILRTTPRLSVCKEYNLVCLKFVNKMQ